jgi:hypothetical protein
MQVSFHLSGKKALLDLHATKLEAELKKMEDEFATHRFKSAANAGGSGSQTRIEPKSDAHWETIRGGDKIR